MRELIFIRDNIDRWKKFENLIDNKSENADEMASMFIQITDDLSYSKTFYPNSDTSKYLNILASKAHQKIYKNKKENKNLISKFWGTELPLILYKSNKYIIISFIIFVSAALIGAFSASQDADFVRIILGNKYVDMTINNIEKGKPMEVYNQTDELSMFLAIAFNNIRVSFLAFIFGIFAGIGTVILLLKNGVMLGSFQYFFYKYGLLKFSALTIWIHGTIEIFVIIVAGAAGLLLGSSLMFPKTYSRLYSFRKAVRIGIKYIIGVLPLFIFAAFLEGFVTRHTELPDAVKLGIILTSLISLIWYFFIMPVKIAVKFNKDKNNYYTNSIKNILKCMKIL